MRKIDHQIRAEPVLGASTGGIDLPIRPDYDGLTMKWREKIEYILVRWNEW